MSRIERGTGYDFTRSGNATTINIANPWVEFYGEEATAVPFTIVNASSGTTYQFSAVPGMVNSLVPQIGDSAVTTQRLDHMPTPKTLFNFDGTTHYSYIYLKVSANHSSTPAVFPVSTETDTKYPRIISASTQQTSDDDATYFLLATAYQDPTTHVITIWQLATGSQWADRIKAGTDTALYFFALA